MPVEQPAPRKLPSNQLTLLFVQGSLFFAAAKSAEEVLPGVEGSNRAVAALLLRGKAEMGSTFIAVLRRYAEALQARDGRLMLVGVEASALEQLRRSGVMKVIGEENVFPVTAELGLAMNQAAPRPTPGSGNPRGRAEVKRDLRSVPPRPDHCADGAGRRGTIPSSTRSMT